MVTILLDMQPRQFFLYNCGTYVVLFMVVDILRRNEDY